MSKVLAHRSSFCAKPALSRQRGAQSVPRGDSPTYTLESKGSPATKNSPGMYKHLFGNTKRLPTFSSAGFLKESTDLRWSPLGCVFPHLASSGFFLRMEKPYFTLVTLPKFENIGLDMLNMTTQEKKLAPRLSNELVYRNVDWCWQLQHGSLSRHDEFSASPDVLGL